MNWDRAQGNWKQFKGLLRQRWARWNADPVNLVAGEREILAGKLQEAYGIGKEQSDRRIKVWHGSMRDAANDDDGSLRRADGRR